MDDARSAAAAIVNPGVGAWLALARRAALQPGETVLVLGATGVSGRIAVALAARMGAGRVMAAGRDRAVLDQLPATVTVGLGGPGDAAALAEAAGQDGIHVIVDYPRGQPTEAAIAAITRRGLAHAAPRVRLVEVGRMAGRSSPCPPTCCAAPGWKSSAAALAPFLSLTSSARYWTHRPSPPPGTCLSTSTRCPR